MIQPEAHPSCPSFDEFLIPYLSSKCKMQPDAPRMLREEVTAEDVSEIVSRWTGIPVQVGTPICCTLSLAI